MHQRILTAFPMHGQHKLANEGYRTRDGHFIEWFGRLVGGRTTVQVVSRPDPILLKKHYEANRVAQDTAPIDLHTLALPNPFNRKAWWVRSSSKYHLERLDKPNGIVAWTPFIFAAPHFDSYASEAPVVLDLLDDWSMHHAFSGIQRQVEFAYASAFKRADTVVANSEATAMLAKRFGRDDVTVMPNGVDWDRFETDSTARGSTTVGYVGKIGKRLDMDLISQVTHDLREFQFIFAGPMLDAGYRKALTRLPNVTWLGDIHYSRVPALLQTFDVGWVPHAVGPGEVGGDAIKIYEYNAAGLPVLSTPIAGAGMRGLSHVTVLPADRHLSFLRSLPSQGARVPRVQPSLLADTTWEAKAQMLLTQLGFPSSTRNAITESNDQT